MAIELNEKERKKLKDQADRLSHSDDELQDMVTTIQSAVEDLAILRAKRNRMVTENLQAEQIYTQLIAEAPPLPREAELENEIRELHNRIKQNDLKDKRYRKPLKEQRQQLQAMFDERRDLQNLKVHPCGGLSFPEAQTRNDTQHGQ